MQVNRNGAISGLVFGGFLCLLLAVFFPHPDFDDLQFTRGFLADVENPKKRRYSFLLEIVDDSENSPTLAIPVNNNQANWDQVAKLIDRIDRNRPIDVWFLERWFFGFPHEVWHLEQDGKVILNFDLKDYEYTLTRKLIGGAGGVALLTSVLLFYRRSKRKSASGV